MGFSVGNVNMSSLYPQYGIKHLVVGVGYDAAEISVIVFYRRGTPISWCTITSSGKGLPPNRIEGFLHIGALCFLNALFMCNIPHFWTRGIFTPHDLMEFVGSLKPLWVSHGQFEQDHFNELATILNVVFSVNHDRQDIQEAKTYGISGPRLNPVTLKDSHYIVDGLDRQFKALSCSDCTSENKADAKSCYLCGSGFGNIPSRTLIGDPSGMEQSAYVQVQRCPAASVRPSPAVQVQRRPTAAVQVQCSITAPTEIECRSCTMLNPIGVANCEMCGKNFTEGGKDNTPLG